MSGGVTTIRMFDGLGRGVSETVDGVGAGHTFDAQGNEMSTIRSDGFAIDRTFSRTGWLLTEIVDPGGEDLLTTHVYDRLGREVSTQSRSLAAFHTKAVPFFMQNPSPGSAMMAAVKSLPFG